MAKMELKWDDVRVFLSAYREEHVGRAAERLGVDASTVSRRLGAFEDELGAALFQRTHDVLLATPAADRLFPCAEEMEAGAANAVRAVLDFETEVEGTVRITAPPGAAELLLAPLLIDIKKQHPGLQFELDGSVALADLSRSEADIALRTIKPRSGDLIVTKFGTTRYVAVASCELAAQLGTLKKWTDAPWISWGAAQTQYPGSQWLESVGVTDLVLRSPSVTAQLAAVESGLGIALMPLVFAQLRDLHPVEFSRKLARDAKGWPVEDLWLVGHEALRSVPRVNAVWSYLLDHLRDSPLLRT